MTTRGVLYVAYGDKARESCARSIQTVRRFLPEIPVAVVSATPLENVECIHIHRPEADPGARTYKTQIYALSPFDETLFLDADTEVVSSPDAGFDLLRFVDVVMSLDCDRRVGEKHNAQHDPAERAATLIEVGLDGDLLYYNSGVIFFKRSARALALFAAWYEEWQRWRRHDQLALARAFYRCPTRVATLRENWNTHHKNEAVFVWHKHRSVSREGAPR